MYCSQRSGRYLAAPREDCDYLLERLCDWLNGEDFVPPNDDWTIPYAVLKAIVAHLYFAWIHPYGDGNGRTARLIELRVLLEAGVPTPSAHVLSNHYNLTRSDYYRHLDQASRNEGGVLAFVEYAVRGFVDGLREQLAMIREQQFSGAATTLFSLELRTDLTRDVEREAGHNDDADWLAPRLFIPASLSTLVFGVLAAIEGSWDFGALWIIIGLVGFGVSFVTGIGYVEPEGEKLKAAVESYGAATPRCAGASAISRWSTASSSRSSTSWWRRW